MTTKIYTPIPTHRNAREINVLNLGIKFTKNDRQCKYIVIHKSIDESICMVTLNQNYEPIAAWRNTKSIVPFKCRHIDQNDKFINIIRSLKPSAIYVNDGILIAPLSNLYKINLYLDRTLFSQLDSLKALSAAVHNNQALEGTTSKPNNNNQLNDQTNNTKAAAVAVMSFDDLKYYYNNLTHKEYRKFVEKYQSLYNKKK